MDTYHRHSRPLPWIGLTGYPGSGKNALAEVLVAEHGFTSIAFADAIREALLGLDPIVDIEKDDGQMVLLPYQRLSWLVNGVGWEEAKRSYPDVRRLLQNLGTEAIRALDPGFWVRIAMKKALEADGPVVFTDTRFPNEIDAIRRQGGILVRVERPGFGPVNSHSSESALDDEKAELVVLNVGPKHELIEHTSTVALITSQIGANS